MKKTVGDYCFKIILHDFTISESVFTPSHPAIANPAFAIRLFHYPTLLVEKGQPLNLKILKQNNKIIPLGKGKSLMLCLTSEEMLECIQNIPLVLQFVDLSENHMKVLAKTHVNLGSFAGSLQKKEEANFKTKTFTMHDELKQTIGTVCTSISLSLKQSIEVLHENIDVNVPMSNPKQTVPAIQKTQNSNTSISKNSSKPQSRGKESLASTQVTTSEKFKRTLRSTQRPIEQNPKTVATSQPYEDQNEEVIVEHEEIQASSPSPRLNIFVPSLKAMAEGNYCPPMMIYQNNEKKVQKEMQTVPRQEALAQTQTLAEKVSAPQAIVLLSKTTGSQNLIDAAFIKEISKSNRLVDVLLRELVKVRAGQLLTQEKVENEQQSQQRDVIMFAEPELNRPSMTLNASASDQALQQALFQTDSPKLSSRKKVEFRDARLAKHRNSDLNVKDLEDTTPNRASIFKDKTQPQPILKTAKGGDNAARRISSSRLSEGYPDDFEEISESLMVDGDELNTSGMKRSTRIKAQESASISEEINASASIGQLQANLRKMKKDDSFRSDKISEHYDEDFEEISDA